MNKNRVGIAQASPGELIAAFLYTCIFGAVALAPVMELISFVPLLISYIMGTSYVHNFATIVTAIVLGLSWLILFLLLWHWIEKDFDYKRSLIKAAIWAGIAAGVFLVAIGGHALADMYIFKT